MGTVWLVGVGGIYGCGEQELDVGGIYGCGYIASG